MSDTAPGDYWSRTIIELNYCITCFLNDYLHNREIIWNVDAVNVCIAIKRNYSIRIMGEGFTIDTTLFDPELFDKIRDRMIDSMGRYCRHKPRFSTALTVSQITG